MFFKMGYGQNMADDTTLRQTAFQFALDIADLCDDGVFCDREVSDMTGQIIASADQIFTWLNAPDRAVRLVMKVGPVTEQT